MFKILSAIFILTAQVVLAQYHGVGALCESIAGPVGSLLQLYNRYR